MAGTAWLCPVSLVSAQESQDPVPAPDQGAGDQPAEGFGYGEVRQRAQELAGEAYQEPNGSGLPEALQNVDYDAYRGIRFKADQALWRSQRRFEVQFFHLGFQYDHPVRVNVISDGTVTPVAFSREAFNYAGSQIDAELPPDLGFAGFRLHYPLHRPDYKDEVAVFLGASYFRVLGRNQVYGLSARGLAIDTAESHGEEFPWFREFWIEEPAPEATSITFHALLDSRSCTGAYRFVMHPGTDTLVEVECTIYPRNEIGKMGIAPLTSMFLHGEDGTRVFDDFRPEVHDSDGLLVATASGEWIWRPLVNPVTLRASASVLENPRGFGLCQRDRNFANYQDLESLYHKRPGLWVEPVGDWGKGRVELIEIPTEEEIHDNIVAYWVSDRPVRPGEPVEYTYRLHAFLDMPRLSPAGRVTATHLGAARSPGRPDVPSEARHFVIDFQGGDLPHLHPAEPVEAVVTVSNGELLKTFVQKNGETRGWRVFFDFIPPGDTATDLRCHLALRGSALTETWTYLWTPS
ncbi:MAG TPA: glucan biosynthesis protein G [Arenibaculum sp.]|nr:glucan biosynthesis protein G [Arenibaculum sp.]